MKILFCQRTSALQDSLENQRTNNTFGTPNAQENASVPKELFLTAPTAKL